MSRRYNRSRKIQQRKELATNLACLLCLFCMAAPLVSILFLGWIGSVAGPEGIEAALNLVGIPAKY